MNEVVTAIVLFKDGGRSIIATLRSVLDQGLPVRVIAVDDGSIQANSVEAFREAKSLYSGQVEFRSDGANRGVVFRLNSLLDSIQSEFLFFLGDDQILPGKLEADVAELRLEKNKNAAIVHSRVAEVDENWNPLKRNESFRPWYGKSSKYKRMDELLWHGTGIQAPTALIRTAALKDIGGWANGFYFEDRATWLRLHKFGWHSVWRDEVTCLYRKLSGGNIIRPHVFTNHILIEHEFRLIEGSSRRLSRLYRNMIVQLLKGRLSSNEFLTAVQLSARLSLSWKKVPKELVVILWLVGFIGPWITRDGEEIN